VLVPVGFGIGIGLIILLAILSQNSRADIERLRLDVPVAETTVTQQQLEIAALRAQIGSAGATADGLNNRIVTMERNRATVYLDLKDIITAAGGKVELSSISHALSSITISGSAPKVKLIYEYARYLRDDSDREFSGVWVSPVTGDSKTGFNFVFFVTKLPRAC